MDVVLVILGVVCSGGLAFSMWKSTAIGRKDLGRLRESWKRVGRDFALRYSEQNQHRTTTHQAPWVRLDGTLEGGRVELLYNHGSDTVLTVHFEPHLEGTFVVGAWGATPPAKIQDLEPVEIGDPAFDRRFGGLYSDPEEAHRVVPAPLRERLVELNEEFEFISLYPDHMMLKTSRAFVEAGSLKEALSATTDVLFALHAASMERHSIQVRV